MKKMIRLVLACIAVWTAGDCRARSETVQPRIAVFGGSFSVIPESNVVKDAWRQELGCAVQDFGVGGAGFAFASHGKDGTNSIPEQVDRVVAQGRTFDLYVLWASTNDSWSRSVAEQNAGIEHCVKALRRLDSKAKIVFFTSQPIPFKPAIEPRLGNLVEGQRAVCAELGLPVLDLYVRAGFTAANSRACFGTDDLHMTREGYAVVRPLALDIVRSALRAEALAVPANAVRVALTFDGSLKDHLLIAAPMLEARGWRGTFNIVTGLVGKNGDFLTWEDVRELVRRGHEVTTHTKTHPDLVKLLNEGRVDEARRGLALSRDEIADKTGFTPRFMCPPFCIQNDATARICREEGLRQMSKKRRNFGANNETGVRAFVDELQKRRVVRYDFLHHGISAADHGGWRPFSTRQAFARHLDEIAALEREGKIIVTDYDGMISDCALKAKTWPRHGVVALSFDDRNLDGWSAALPIFSKYGAQVTFCLSGDVDSNAVSFVRRAMDGGHELALHGLRHRNADEAVRKLGAENYWTAEIAPQLDACKAAGIPVRTFAYPNCCHDTASDELFAAHGFTRLRGSVSGVASPNPYDPKGERLAAWHPVATFDGAFASAVDYLTERNIANVIVGESYHTDIEDILRAIRRAGERGELISLVSHKIGPGARSINMKTEWLERILASAREAGVLIRGLR